MNNRIHPNVIKKTGINSDFRVIYFIKKKKIKLYICRFIRMNRVLWA